MISIAMTTYNGEKYIEKQLLSILNQTIPADEIIICDDCSKDNTVKIIDQILKNTGTEILVRLEVNDSNLGYIGNFYKAICLTTGDYIFLADQDDIWHSDKIETMVALMKKTNAQAICTNFSLIDQNGNRFADESIFHINHFIRKCRGELKEIKCSRLVFGNIVQGCTYCFTAQVRDVYEKVGIESILSHDYQIMFLSSLLGKVYFYNTSLIDYRIHSQNTIGIEKKSNLRVFEIKRFTKRPAVIRYLKKINSVIRVPHLLFYCILYKLKIPSILLRIFR